MNAELRIWSEGGSQKTDDVRRKLHENFDL